MQRRKTPPQVRREERLQAEVESLQELVAERDGQLRRLVDALNSTLADNREVLFLLAAAQARATLLANAVRNPPPN